MMKSLGVAFLALSLALSAGGYAQESQPGLPLPGQERSVEVPSPSQFRLSNGLLVWQLPSSAAGLTGARLVFKSGAAGEPAALAGLARLTTELMRRGTCRHNATEFAASLESLGSSLGIGAGWDSSNAALSTSDVALQPTLELLRDTLTCPAFEQSEVDRLKKEMLDDYQVSRQDPGQVADWIAELNLFQGTPNNHLADGTAESIAGIRREDVSEFFYRSFTPEQSALVIATSISVEKLKAILENTLAAWHSRDGERTSAETNPDAAFNLPHCVLIDKPDAEQASLIVTFPGVARRDPDYRRTVLMSAVLGSGYSSRLNRQVRIGEGLSYGVYSAVVPRLAGGGFQIGAKTANANLRRVLDLVLAESVRLKTKRVSVDELDVRRRALLGGFLRSFESNAGMIGAFSDVVANDLNLRDLLEYQARFNSISIRDIQEIAEKVFRFPEVRITAVGAISGLIGKLDECRGETLILSFDSLDPACPGCEVSEPGRRREGGSDLEQKSRFQSQPKRQSER